MAVIISQGLIDEMTLVGDGFAPRNPKAKALAVKAAAVQTAVANGTETAVVLETFDIEGEAHVLAPDAPSFVTTVAKASPEVLPEFVEKGYIVPVKPKGDIKPAEGNDATEHYEEAVRHIANTHYDLQNAMGLNSPAARSAAVVATVDSHFKAMSELKGGQKDVERKAGRKFSQKTLDRITAIQAELGALVANEPEEEAVVEGEPVVAEETEAEKAAKLIPVEPAKPTPAEVANGAVADPKVEAAKGGVVTADLALPPNSLGTLQAEAIQPPAITPETIAAIAAAVKASIVIPDNAAALDEIASKMDTLSTRVEAVEGTVTVTSAKAAANEAMLQTAVGQAMQPLAPGGVASMMEDGSGYVAPAGTNLSQRGAKAAPVTLTPDMHALDGVRAIQEASKAARGR